MTTKKGNRIAKRVTPPAPRKVGYRICRDCHKRLIKIVYGMPTAEMMREAKAGRILLGGCCIVEGGPVWACPKCGPRPPPHPELDADTKHQLADLATLLIDLIADRVRSPAMVARLLWLRRELATSDELEQRASAESNLTARTADTAR